jgi:hypothetical protein
MAQQAHRGVLRAAMASARDHDMYR